MPKFMTGAKPTPRHKLAAAAPYRIRGATPPQFSVLPAKLSMWLNDKEGDCVTAEEAYAKAVASLAGGGPELFITDATVQAWASKHGVTDGAVISEVLDWMAQQGFSQDGKTYNDGRKVSVDWTNSSLLANAISQGPVKIGVAAAQLMNVVSGGNGWFATGFRHDAELDHCVSLSGYGSLEYLFGALGVPVPNGADPAAPGYHLFTWSTVGVIDRPSLLAITGEAWLRNPTNVSPTPGPHPGPGPGPAPRPLPPFWRSFLARVETLLRTFGPAALPIIEAWVNTMQLPPAVLAAVEALLVKYLGQDRPLGVATLSFAWPTWHQVIEEVADLLHKFGPAAAPLVREILETTGLPSAVVAAIEALLAAVLGPTPAGA